MGREATASKRTVLDVARKCIEQTNANTSDLTRLGENHNALCQQVKKDIEALNASADAIETTVNNVGRCAHDRMDRMEWEYHSFISMTFWQRLRWLFTGRWQVKPRTARPRARR